MSVWATTGDHCQLPPSVQSREAERRGLTLSLYLRLVGQVSQSAPLRKHANTRGYAEARPIVLTAGEFLAGRSDPAHAVPTSIHAQNHFWHPRHQIPVIHAK